MALQMQPTHQTYTADPVAAVKESFTLSGSGGGDAGPGGRAPTPKAQPAVALPPPLSTATIESLYQPLRHDIETLPPPAARPVPPPPPALNSFLSLLGANLGASLLRDPGAADKIFGYMQEKEQQRQAIEDQNYAQNLAFNENKKAQLVAIRGKALETALQVAIQSNDAERAAKIAENLHRLQAETQAQTVIPAMSSLQIEKAKEIGRQQRLTLADQIKMKLEATTASGKLQPITGKDFLKSIDDINKNKELTTHENGLLGGLLQGIFGGDKKVSKKDMLKASFVTGIMAGDPGVKADAKRRLLMTVYSDLGWLGRRTCRKFLPRRKRPSSPTSWRNTGLRSTCWITSSEKYGLHAGDGGVRSAAGNCAARRRRSSGG